MSKVKSRFWFYRPSVHWYGWKALRPFWFGDDEFHRKTVVIGWNPTGQVVIALWRFRNCGEDCEGRTECPVCTASVWYGDDCRVCTS